nr:beta-ketoacyl-ACP synthase III [Pantoea sp. Ap-967]
MQFGPRCGPCGGGFTHERGPRPRSQTGTKVPLSCHIPSQRPWRWPLSRGSIVHNVVISGTGLYTPAQSISNEELVASFNAWSAQYNQDNAAAIERGELEAAPVSDAAFIEKASGIKSRFVMDKAGILDPQRMKPRLPERSNDEQSILCEMGVAAARQALERAGRTAADVDGVIVACSNLQRPYPAIAIEVQQALGIDGFAFDMNVACSSATFGIQTAANNVQLGQSRAVLVVSPEICTGHLNFRDRDSHFIFGDAATAVLVERADQASSRHQFDILGTKLKTAFSNNIRNNFGFLNRAAEEGIGARDKLFVQEGRKVFKEVCPMVAELIGTHLGEHNLQPSDVQRFWLHQANLSMNHLIVKKLMGREVNEHEAPVILDRYANTSSAGSVIAFHLYQDDLAQGALAVLSSFGAGYSIGSVILRKR